MTYSVLVVAAHSDDEALGCAGTIARHVQEGDAVNTIFLTDGVSARNNQEQSSTKRATAAKLAGSILGSKSTTQLNFPDNSLDSIALLEITQAVEEKAQSLEPQIVYTHHAGDLNIDHRICHQAVLTAFRPTPTQSVTEIYGFETVSSTEWAFGGANAFNPQHYVDISSTIKIKMQALKSYDEEMRPFPHARSYEAVRALATLRGSSVGCTAAEAFTVIRTLRR